MKFARLLYDVLRLLGVRRREIVEKTLAQIEQDEKAAAKRTIDAVNGDSACPPSG